MAGGTRQTNTMEEQLRKFLGQLADLKLAEDADFDFITQLETAVIGKLREPIDRVAEAGLTQAPPQAAMGMPMDPAMAGGATPGGMPGGMPMDGGGDPEANAIADVIIAAMGGPDGAPPMPPMGGTGTPIPPGRGPTPSAPMPNPDELRRVVNHGPR